MPAYELNLILKRLPKPAMVAACVRVGEKILENDSVLRRIEFLGHKHLHYSLQNRHVPGSPRFKQGSFFLYHFDTAAKKSKIIYDDLRLDYDIIHLKILPKLEPLQDYKCTLEEELQTPANRSSVEKLIRDGQWAKKLK